MRAALRLREGVRANEEWDTFYGGATADLDELDRVVETGETSDFFATLVEQCAAMVEDVPVVRREHQVLDASGALRWIRSTWNVPVVEGQYDHASVLVSDVDVTTLKEAEAVLAEQIDSKDRFLASISHEFRTPITAVAGFAHELATGLDRFDTSEARELLSLVAREASDVAGIVDDLLVAAPPDDFGLTVVAERVAVADVVASMAPGAQVDWTTDLQVAAMADAGRVRQIVRNLVANAVRHGGGAVGVEIGAAADTVTIAVWDDGPGVPDELEDSLFDAYVRGKRDPGLTDSFGLGLYISRRLAVQMGGDLTHDRRNGRTEFRLVLPIHGEDHPAVSG